MLLYLRSLTPKILGGLAISWFGRLLLEPRPGMRKETGGSAWAPPCGGSPGTPVGGVSGSLELSSP